MSSETLQAIAGAFDVSIDLLRYDAREPIATLLGVAVDDLTPELVAQKVGEAKSAFDKDYSMIGVEEVTCSGQLACAFAAHGLLLQCESRDDAVRDLVAELNACLMDMLDLAGDLPPASRREFEKSTFAVVERLIQVGYVVEVALQPRSIALGNGSKVRMDTLLVVVSLADEAAGQVAVKKSLPLA